MRLGWQGWRLRQGRLAHLLVFAAALLLCFTCHPILRGLVPHSLGFVSPICGSRPFWPSRAISRTSTFRRVSRAASASEEVRRQLLASEICGDVEQKSSFSTTFTLETDRGKCFVKCGTGGAGASKAILEYEAESLRRLGAAAAGSTLRVPEPWLVGELSPGRAFIVQEYFELGGSCDRNALGAGLAQIHAADAPDDWQHFGFPLEGCCGACPQKNNAAGAQMNWVDFWRDYRLGDQLRMLRRNSPSDNDVQELGKQVMERLPELFEPLGEPESIKPSLLHGDLWSGNINALRDGSPVIIDPATYYGHYEADHGMNYMFGGGTAFNNAGYQQRFPRAPGYERRIALYELHHHLNHYNIFGGGYRGGCLSLMKQLLR